MRRETYSRKKKKSIPDLFWHFFHPAWPTNLGRFSIKGIGKCLSVYIYIFIFIYLVFPVSSVFFDIQKESVCIYIYIYYGFMQFICKPMYMFHVTFKVCTYTCTQQICVERTLVWNVLDLDRKVSSPGTFYIMGI